MSQEALRNPTGLESSPGARCFAQDSTRTAPQPPLSTPVVASAVCSSLSHRTQAGAPSAGPPRGPSRSSPLLTGRSDRRELCAYWVQESALSISDPWLIESMDTEGQVRARNSRRKTFSQGKLLQPLLRSYLITVQRYFKNKHNLQLFNNLVRFGKTGTSKVN